jgi:16S rRNA (cytosine967-C5)-methyltransferase
MIAPARIAAYDILRAVTSERLDLPAAIADARDALPDDRDRSLAAEIATGVQRWRNMLDHLIVQFAGRSIERLDSEVVDILRLSIYQLLHLTRVPASAVVDDAVKLTRRAAKTSAAGFVNGVLRAVSRRRRVLPLPAVPADETDREAALSYLTITLSHPRWLAARYLDRHGFADARAWLEFNNQPAPLTLRINSLRNTRTELLDWLANDDVQVRATRFAPDGLIVTGGQPLRGSGLSDGRFVVQDEASQLIALLAGDAPGGRVLDACAAPGGKTTALAAAMSGGLLVASDVRDRRMALLGRTVAASGARHVRLVQADLLRPLPFAVAFDCVVVDAPCSGLGILRRDPDIRWKRSEADLSVLAAAQIAMLRHAAAVVRPDGRLVYSTCSSEPEENEGVVAEFLSGAPAFSLLSARRASSRLSAEVIDSDGFLRTLPFRHALEGFFGAVFHRRDTIF